MIEIVLALIGVMGSVFAYLFGRKKTTAEIKVIEEGTKTTKIDNEIKMSEYYKEMLDDLSSRYESKYKEVVALYEDRIKLLKSEIVLLRKQNSDLKKRVKELEV